MRGKKVDSEFLSNFIANCVKKGMETPNQFVENARQQIAEIDEEIKRVENKKITRSKLLDVISTFDKSTKSSNVEEIRALPFFKIQQPIICKYICDILKKNPTTLEGFGKIHQSEDLIFGIKQLLEHKIIHKTNSLFLRGEMFEEYLKFVLKEY